jgi:hypothetical protein
MKSIYFQLYKSIKLEGYLAEIKVMHTGRGDEHFVGCINYKSDIYLFSPTTYEKIYEIKQPYRTGYGMDILLFHHADSSNEYSIYRRKYDCIERCEVTLEPGKVEHTFAIKNTIMSQKLDLRKIELIRVKGKDIIAVFQ